MFIVNNVFRTTRIIYLPYVYSIYFRYYPDRLRDIRCYTVQISDTLSGKNKYLTMYINTPTPIFSTVVSTLYHLIRFSFNWLRYILLRRTLNNHTQYLYLHISRTSGAVCKRVLQRVGVLISDKCLWNM